MVLRPSINFIVKILGYSLLSLLNETGFPGGSDGKESAWKGGDPGSTADSGRSPGEGNGYPLQYSCLENSMDRGLVGYSPWGQELDVTKRLNNNNNNRLILKIEANKQYDCKEIISWGTTSYEQSPEKEV